jgi:CHC2-type zinc finger protein
MIRAAPIYQDLPERRGVSRRRVIGEAKEKVATIGLEDRLCGPGRLRRRGKEWMDLCPLSGHEERTPSFTLNPENNVFWCFGCLRGVYRFILFKAVVQVKRVPSPPLNRVVATPL